MYEYKSLKLEKVTGLPQGGGLEKWVGWVKEGGLQDSYFFHTICIFSHGIDFYLHEGGIFQINI